MKIINTVAPQQYSVCSGDGASVYSYIDFVVLNKDSITINVVTPENPIVKELKITDPEIIAILPSLLNGKVSCFEAMESLEPFLRKKHNLFPQSSSSFFQPNPKKLSLGFLVWDLLKKEDFAVLCQFFPHEHTDRFKWMQDTPIKVVSKEIIEAIEENFLCDTKEISLIK